MKKMKTLTQEEVNEIIARHQHWLQKDCDGWETMQADFSNCYLRGLNFEHATLSHASFDHAILDETLFNGAILMDASFRYTSLNFALLNDARLDNASFYCAELYGAFLNNASLIFAHLHQTSFEHASLNNASLNHAILKNVIFSHALLNNAMLNDVLLNRVTFTYASLSNVSFEYTLLHNVSFDCASLNNVEINLPLTCPSHGEFIGWKRVGKHIVKLRIPADAKRSNATTNKCRCDKAFVLAIQNEDGTGAEVDEVTNRNFIETTYRVGEMVYPDSFDENRWNECSHGIHFFVDRQEAVNYGRPLKI